MAGNVELINPIKDMQATRLEASKTIFCTLTTLIRGSWTSLIVRLSWYSSKVWLNPVPAVKSWMNKE